MKIIRSEIALNCILALIAIASIIASVIVGEVFRVTIWGIIFSAVTVIVCSLHLAVRVHTRRTVWPVIVMPIVILFLITSVTSTHWPLRVAYKQSLRSLDDIADRVLEGEEVAKGTQVGFFTIRRAEISHKGDVCLWTRLHPNGNTGFIQKGPLDQPLHCWSAIILDERWQFISEE